MTRGESGARVEPDVLTTDRVVLRLATEQEAKLVLDYFVRNRAHLAPWEPAPPTSFYTEAFWLERLAHFRRERAAGTSARFHMFEKPSGRVIGSIGISNVVRGCFHSAHLGFGLDASREGQGVMREALEAVIGWCWDELGLHRLEANHQPQNLKSAALLRRLGFTPIGYARDYLLIDGKWVDHVLNQRLNPRWAPTG